MKTKKMKENEVKVCKIPGCKKEVHDNKSLFCLEHDRDIRDKGKKAGQALQALVAVAVVGVSFLAKGKPGGGKS